MPDTVSIPGLLGLSPAAAMEALHHVTMQSIGVWSVVIPLCAFLTGGIVVQCHLYILNNPDEPKSFKWLAIFMTVIQLVEAVIEAIGDYKARVDAVEGRVSVSAFIPWFAPSTCILTAVSGAIIHVFFARIVYRMIRSMSARRAWLAFSTLMVSGVLAGGFGSGVIYGIIEAKPPLTFALNQDLPNLDLDLHVLWAASSGLFDLTLSGILVFKLLTSVNSFSFPSTNSKLVSLAISVLETLALPTMASLTCLGLAIYIRRLPSFIFAPWMALIDMSIVMVNSRLYAISLIYTLNRRGIARREVELPPAVTAFHLQEVLSNAQYSPSQPRLPAQVMIVTETVVNVDEAKRDELPQRGGLHRYNSDGKSLVSTRGSDC